MKRTIKNIVDETGAPIVAGTPARIVASSEQDPESLDRRAKWTGSILDTNRIVLDFSSDAPAGGANCRVDIPGFIGEDFRCRIFDTDGDHEDDNPDIIMRRGPGPFV